MNPPLDPYSAARSARARPSSCRASCGGAVHALRAATRTPAYKTSTITRPPQPAPSRGLINALVPPLAPKAELQIVTDLCFHSTKAVSWRAKRVMPGRDGRIRVPVYAVALVVEYASDASVLRTQIYSIERNDTWRLIAEERTLAGSTLRCDKE